MRAILTLFVLAVATAQQVAAQPAAINPCNTAPPVYDCTDDACLMTVQFVKDTICRHRIDDPFIAATNKAEGKGRLERSSRKTARRITEKTSLRVKVTHANHLRFKIAFDTTEVAVESYVYLERLWKQVVGLRAFGIEEPAAPFANAPDTDREDKFIAAIKAWRAVLLQVDVRLEKRLSEFNDVALTDGQINDLVAHLEDVAQDVGAIESRHSASLDSVWRSENYPVFDATKKLHDEVVARLDSFVTLGGYSVYGLTRPVKFGAAGRIVTTTITATHRASAAVAPEGVVVEFLVHSTLPVTFHAGAVYRSGDELRFEPAATAAAGSGSVDLFRKLNSSKPPADLTAFMSYDFSTRERVGPFWRAIPSLTLGTGLTNVGERLYVGASWRFGRAILTAGAVSLDVSEAEPVAKDVLGAVGQLTGAQDLFSQVATRRRFRPFVGVSFAPF